MDMRNLKGAMYTPQSQPIRGREAEMKKNLAGGYGFKEEPELVFLKFLLFNPRDTYYKTEQEFYRDLIAITKEVYKLYGDRIFNLMDYASQNALRPHSWLIALAILMRIGTVETKHKAREFFVSHVNSLNYVMEFLEIWKIISPRKSNSLIRRTISQWFERMGKDAEYQAAKFFERKGWSVYDLLRFAHVPMDDFELKDLALDIRTFAHKKYKGEYRTKYFQLKQKVAMTTDPRKAAKIIEEEGAVREFVPDELKENPFVLRAIAKRAPYLSFIKMLPELTQKLTGFNAIANDKEFRAFVVNKIHKSAERLHPFDLAIMQFLYAKGESQRRTWRPVREIEVALTDAAEKAFNRYREIESPFKDKRVLLAIDTSGSMRDKYPMTPSGIIPIEAAAVIGKIIGGAANRYIVGTFSDSFEVSNYDLTGTFEDVANQLRKYGRCCSTNAGSVVEWLLSNNTVVDFIVMVTDDESWEGNHFSELIKTYRMKIGKDVPVLLINVVPNDDTSIIDPQDPFSLQIMGDSADVMRTAELFATGNLTRGYIRKILGVEG